MLANDIGGNGEAESGPVFLGGKERIEDTVELLGRDAVALDR